MKAILLTAVTIFTLAFSSCSKCTVCTKTSEPETRYCEKDFDSNTAYGVAIDIKEGQGYDCKKSI